MSAAADVGKPTMARRYGVPSYLYAAPLHYGLAQKTYNVNLKTDLVSQNALRLKSKELDLALLSPIEYARNSSEYRILPNICASHKGGNRTILLHFRVGLERIKTIATDIGLTSELVLAKVILTEKYETNPEFIPLAQVNAKLGLPDILTMLEKADAALVIGGPSSSTSNESKQVIDLVDEWHDLTELPYLHSLWLGHRDTITSNDLSILTHAAEEGGRHLREIAGSEASERGLQAAECEYYLRSFNYRLDEEVREGLAEFYRFAFYYGILGEVPEIKFYSEDDGLSISMN